MTPNPNLLLEYERRIPEPSETLVPLTILRATGALTLSNSCFTFDDVQNTRALIFKSLVASFDQATGELVIGVHGLEIGQKISVKSPFNQQSADFSEDDINERCKTDGVWLLKVEDLMPEE